jgi:hypothetical protein
VSRSNKKFTIDFRQLNRVKFNIFEEMMRLYFDVGKSTLGLPVMKLNYISETEWPKEFVDPKKDTFLRYYAKLKGADAKAISM